LVQFDKERFRAHGAQRLLGRLAVRAVGFAEDRCCPFQSQHQSILPPIYRTSVRQTKGRKVRRSEGQGRAGEEKWRRSGGERRTDGVVVDDLLRFGLGGRHGGWTGAAPGRGEELA